MLRPAAFAALTPANCGTGASEIAANGDVTGTDNISTCARHFAGGPIGITGGSGATAAGCVRSWRA